MASRVIAWAEPLVVIATAPLLLFPMLRPAWTATALALLVITWCVRWALRREPWPVTPFNAALLLFCLSIPLAVWASSAPDLTIPKLTGLILGLAAFRVLAFSAHPGKPFKAAGAVFVALGLGIWVLGLLGVRLLILTPLLQRLPTFLVSLPGAPDQGINPNQLAGVLVLYLPFLLVLALLGFLERRILLGASLAVVALAAVATLVLTGSRAGWVGLAAATPALGLLLVGLEGSRRIKHVALAAAIAVLVLGLVAGAVLAPQRLSRTASLGQGEQEVGTVLRQMSLDGRLEIWSRALYAIEDFPFTGIGLGTFRRVVNVLYPLFLVPPDQDVGHAHNMFLQAAVDLGLGGLIAYIALLVIAGVAALDTAIRQTGPPRYLALGLLASLIGLHVYGLADALALGSKPGLAFWMVLGLIAALAAAASPATERSTLQG